MDRERAEVHLRLLVEAQLRQAPAGPVDGFWRTRYGLRLSRVARALTAVGALDSGVADEVLEDFEAAWRIRQTGSSGFRLPGRGSYVARPSAAPGRVVSLGQRIGVRDADVSGELYLLSYLRTVSGPEIGVFAWTRNESGMSKPAGPRFFDRLTVTDDTGIGYRLTVRDLGGEANGWTLMLQPAPSHDPRWLEVSVAGGEPAVRIGLTGSGSIEPEVCAGTLSPGEHLLHRTAGRLLAETLAVPPGTGLPAGEPLAGGADGLGDIITALQACDGLAPASPLPGQLAALCARLGVGGHGITAPPARDLPEPWLNVLDQGRPGNMAMPPGDGCAAMAVMLPELDGIALAILGLHNYQHRSVMHAHASGPAAHRLYELDRLHSWPVIWIRDSRSSWHATRICGQSGMNDGTALRLEVVPPLSRSTAWIDVIADGLSARARATIPLRWE